MQPTIITPPSRLQVLFSHRVLLAVILSILVATSAYLWILYGLETPPKKFNLRVEQGDTIHAVARKLVAHGVIKHTVFFYFTYYAFGHGDRIEPGGYAVSSTMKLRDIVHTLESQPVSRFVELPSGASKEDIAAILAKTLGWGEVDRQFFGHTYAGMQWQQYQESIEEAFQKYYSWTDQKTHTFLTLSALYYDQGYDFLKQMYVPGVYEIPNGSSRAQVAGIFMDRFLADNPDDRVALERSIDRTSADKIAKLLDEQMVLMPDIVALPPQDVVLKTGGGRSYLRFTTSYWNKGRGPLELVADAKTKAVAGDVERNVFQRIYRLDGDYTERLSGKFLWHSPHLHYHFQDFAAYELESLAPGGTVSGEKQSQKSTFCIRDSEPIDLAHPGATKSPSYTICGKERQGISPGWADSYYYTYVDQLFDVTDYPKGEYRLKIVINPLERFQEITKDNNVGEVVLDMDVANNTVKVISEKTYGL